MSLSFIYEPYEGGISLCGVYGETPSPVLPEKIDGKKIIRIGRYCFAPEGREPENALRFPADGNFSHRIGGNFLESISLPDGIEILDNAAFYNCRMIHTISIGKGLKSCGSDLFTNCWELKDLQLGSHSDEESGLKKLLAVLSGDIHVHFMDGAELFYPEYFESMDENTPAHIFNYSISGTGYRYRQCFAASGGVNFSDYDKIFPIALPIENTDTLTQLALYRIVSPISLAEEAENGYRSFLLENQTDLVKLLLQLRSSEKTENLARKGLLSREALTLLAASAVEKGWNEGSILAGRLIREIHGNKKKKYTF